MKYCTQNKLEQFEFHDSEFSLVRFDKKDLIASVKYLNIQEAAEENPYDCDMEIERAIFHFGDVHILSFEPARAYQKDADGNWYTDEPQIVFTGKAAEEKLISELENGFSVNGIAFARSDTYTLEIEANGPEWFCTKIAFSDVSVSWDAYRKKAWYELHKQYRYEITLMTPNGEQRTSLHIECHEEDMYDQGKLVKAPIVSAGIKYQDREMWGHGKDYFWVDAFADLQKQLPDGACLKCCLTCRHGNMCPFGNKPGEIFCTKGVEITSKNQLCDWFNREELSGGIQNRIRSYADTCEDHKPQSHGFYTYSDYLYELEK